MVHITSARIRKVESICRRQASTLRREHGQMARAQVKKTPDVQTAIKLKETLTKNLLQDLAESYPKDGFTHEGQELKAPQEDGYMWHINALGALENFVRGKEHIYQLFVLTQDGEAVEAFGYKPLTDEICLSVKNNGATGYEGRLRVSGRINLDDGCVHLAPESASLAGKLVDEGISVRVTGSIMTDILDVCAGRAEGYYASEMPMAEALFAEVMIAESGGKASAPSENGSFQASNLDCFSALSKLVG